MATSYLELKAQAEKLLAQAEELRVKEINDVIADIKQKIATFGLTAQDLGLSAVAGGGARRKIGTSSAKKTGTVKYRGPNGETWSGGRGRKPQWVVNALASGKSLDEFLV